MYYLYKITNPVNNKVYIGFSATPKKRWTEHRRAARNGCTKHPKLYAALRKYGWEAFTFEVMKEGSDRDQMLLAEKEAIEQHENGLLSWSPSL